MRRFPAGFVAIALMSASAPLSYPQAAPPTATAPSANAAATAPDEKSLQEINDLRAGLVDAFNKKDVDKMVSYLHPDIVVTWQNAEVSKGRDAVKAFYTRMMVGDNRVCDSVTAAPVVEGRQLLGDTSISYGHMNDTFKLTNGMEFHPDSRFSAWLVRENGQWLVRGFHLSGNLFDNDIQKIYVRKTATWAALAAGVGGLIIGWLIARGTRAARKTV